jgi:hypothetical protein
MSIYLLKDRLNEYDKYGIHRTNGFKAVYILELMLLFELMSSMTQPYFYYFFVAITCLNAEVAGNSLKQKYQVYIFSMVGAMLFIFIFDVFSIHPLLFLCVVFIFSAGLYYFILCKYNYLLPAAPLILGLASYSLLYVDVDRTSSLYAALNHSMQIFFALSVVLLGLLVFPKSFYYAIWRRAFCDVMNQLASITENIIKNETRTISISTGIIMMERYAMMLPKDKKCFRRLKITRLTSQLVFSMSYLLTFRQLLNIDSMRRMHHYFVILSDVCKTDQPIAITENEKAHFYETKELEVMYRLILSWNSLCGY